MQNVSGFLSWATDHLTRRTEYAQSLLRVLCTFSYISYLLLSHHNPRLLLIVGVYGIASLLWYGIVAKWPESTWRYNISLLADQVMVTFALLVEGPFHPGLLFMYCWISIDYGYRYGSWNVVKAGTLSAVGFSILMTFSPLWDAWIEVPFEVLVVFALLTGYKYKILWNLEYEADQKSLYQRKAEKAEKEVVKDSLTGLCNRAYGESWLKEKHKKNTRVSVLFLDLDEFKKFNDNYGHHVGDQVLINISKRLVNCVREGDVVCRYAGDEFIILLDDEDSDTIKQIGERITRALNQSVQIESGERLTVTGSIGIAVLGIHGDTPAKALRNADAAMYMAKRAGRNRMAWYEEKVKG